jgi:hypothetical protein
MNQKLDVPTVFERILQVYRDQFGLLIPAALVLFVPLAILNGLFLTTGNILGALLAAVVGAIGTYWFQGMVVEATHDILDGRRDHTIGSLFGSVAPVLLPLIGAGILAGLGIGLGLILLIVPGLFLLTIWAVLAPVIVVERKPVFEAFGRSRELVRGSGWPVFGVIVVLFLLQVVAGGVISAIFRSIADNFAGYALGDLVVRVLISPLSALAAAVMFFELKRLKGEPAIPGAAQPPAGPAEPSVQPAPATQPTEEQPTEERPPPPPPASPA